MEDCSNCTPRSDGEFGEMPRIFMHALVGIDADRTDLGQPVGAMGLQPFTHQILDQALAQLELQHFGQPALDHIQDQKAARDDAETRRAAP